MSSFLETDPLIIKFLYEDIQKKITSNNNNYWYPSWDDNLLRKRGIYMISLKDFCNTVNPNTTVSVYIEGEAEPTYEDITVYELKQMIPKFVREVGLRYVKYVDCLDHDVDMSIELSAG